MFSPVLVNSLPRAPVVDSTRAPAESASAQICVGVQSLKVLDGCEKTLQAVWKRAARKRQAAGGQATPFGSPTGAAQGSPMAGTPMPPERMQKWGFLVKHERWLAVEGYSVTVSQNRPQPQPQPQNQRHSRVVPYSSCEI